MRAEQKQIAFKCNLQADLPDGVRADEKRLRQVLINLLGNAVKFTDHGRVMFKVSPTGPGRQHPASGPELRTIRFEIMDTGIGMTPDQLERVFLPFEQAGPAGTRAAGTGLGLAISRRLVELMDSEIKVFSEPGKGSTFWFDVDLPVVSVLEQGIGTETRSVAGYKGKRRTVMVADDEQYSRLLFVNLLEPLGFDVVPVENGRELIDNALKKRPDIIFTDMAMPVLAGYDAVRRIRGIPELSHMPIIAVSASVFDSDKRKGMESGCNDFLSKPVNTDQLFDILQSYLNLEWVHEEVKIESMADTEAMAVPPVRELALLHEMALDGNILRILEYANELGGHHVQYHGFARKLEALAREYKDKEILELIETCLENSE